MSETYHAQFKTTFESELTAATPILKLFLNSILSLIMEKINELFTKFSQSILENISIGLKIRNSA